MKFQNTFLLILFAYVILAVNSLCIGGVTWDEILDFEGVNGAFWHAINTLKGATPDYKTITYDLEYYGNFFRWPVYIFWRLIQVAPWENLSGLPRSSYLLASGYVGLNHLSSILFGLGSAFLLYRLALVLQPSARFLAPALLLSLPVWIGHSWFNSKDVPLAFAYITYTYGSTLTIQSYRPSSQGPRPLSHLRSYSAYLRGNYVLALRTFGIAALVGSRLGMLPFVVISELIFLILNPTIRQLKSCASAFGLGVFLAYLATPQAWASPIVYLKDTLDHYATRSSGGTSTETAFYISHHLFETLPLVLLIGILVFLLSFKRVADPTTYLEYVPIALQGLLAPLLLIIAGKSLYNELRQILFVYPSYVFFASIGIASLVPDRRSFFGSVLPVFPVRRIVLFLLSVCWIVLWLDNIMISPYQYVYRSELARILNPSVSLNSDYWGFSVREVLGKCFRSEDCSYALRRFPVVRNGWSWNPDLVDAVAFLVAPSLSFDGNPDVSGSEIKIFSGYEDGQSCETLSKVERRPFAALTAQTIYSLKKCPS